MALNENQAFEIENGVTITEENQNTTGPFYTGGPASPIGLNLSQDTFYVQSAGDRIIIWQKFGAGVNDWKVFPASDISFDPTGVQNLDPSDDTVQLAVQKLGNQTLGDLVQGEAFNSIALESTTSNGWVSKSGFPFTTEVKTAGQFAINWSSEVGQTKNNRNFGFRVRVRPTGGSYTILGEVELSVNRDDDLMMQSGFQEVVLATDNSFDIDVQFGQTINGSSCLIRNVSVQISRTGD